MNAEYWRKRLAELEQARSRLDRPIAEARQHLRNAESREGNHEKWKAKFDSATESEKLERWLVMQKGVGRVRVERVRQFLTSRRTLAEAVRAGHARLPGNVVDKIEQWPEYGPEPKE